MIAVLRLHYGIGEVGGILLSIVCVNWRGFDLESWNGRGIGK